jgi:hypothetical protein
VQTAPPADELPTVAFVQVDARYFDVLGITMTRGRSFIPSDAESGRQGVVIDQRLADSVFAGHEPLGLPIRLVDPTGQEAGEVRSIVGIAPTVPQNLGMREGALPVVFAPLSPATPAALSLIVRSRSDMASSVSQLREEVRAIDSGLPVYYAQTLDAAFAEARYGIRIIGGWFTALAVIAVALAAIGLFGITRHAVAQRTQEIGVRIALGARSGEVVWLFLRRTLVQLALGTAIGLAGALAVGQLLRNFIGRTDPRDPPTLTCVTLLIVVVAIGATLLPARRATRIDPIAALRYE